MRTVAAGAALAVLLAAPFAAQDRGAPRSFKVATWNIRSGMGIRGFKSSGWNSDSLNCSDRSKPMNAWGLGLPQKELERIKADSAIVALALQEAWNCGSPSNVNSVLGFKGPLQEQEGVTLLTRFGFSGQPMFHNIDKTHNRWVYGGAVCLNAQCSATLPIFSTHFGGTTDDDFPKQAASLVQTLAAERAPHLVMGDFNLFKIDRWNPAVACTNKDSSGRVAAIAAIERAGYADTWKQLESGEGWTGMASRPGCGSPTGGLFKRIDYVYTKGLKAIGIRRFAQVPPGTDSPSDHAGLVAEFESPR